MVSQLLCGSGGGASGTFWGGLRGRLVLVLFFLFLLEYVKWEIKKKKQTLPCTEAQNPTEFVGALGLHPFSGKLQSKETGQIAIFI